MAIIENSKKKKCHNGIACCFSVCVWYYQLIYILNNNILGSISKKILTQFCLKICVLKLATIVSENRESSQRTDFRELSEFCLNSQN